MGSIIGVGIFSLPVRASPSYGPISLVAMALATVGAVALAVMFAVMSKRMPAGGGPYAYVRAAFGDGLGFSQAWLYWITAWAGNAAIVVGLGASTSRSSSTRAATGGLDRHRPGRSVDPGGDQPDRRQEHGRRPELDRRC